jgi:pimeloyl-ACP methyl ester carboxylesterase
MRARVTGPGLSIRVRAFGIPLCALTWALSGVVLPVGAAERDRARPAQHYETMLTREAISRGPCEVKPGRVFVAHGLGSECIAYYEAGVSTNAVPTIFVFDGDVPPADATAPGKLDDYLGRIRRFLDQRGRAHGVRYIFVARPGVFGSSGNHGGAKRPTEIETINAAVDEIKQRLKLDKISLAGQSGGSTVAAGLLALGRTDIACAVLASGGFDMPDIITRARIKTQQSSGDIEREKRQLAGHFFDVLGSTARVANNPERRIFVLADPQDKRTPFDQQQRYADGMTAAGHKTVVLTANGRGKERHGLTLCGVPFQRTERGTGPASSSFDRSRDKPPDRQRKKVTCSQNRHADSRMAPFVSWRTACPLLPRIILNNNNFLQGLDAQMTRVSW